jgi:hypothetical protein
LQARSSTTLAEWFLDEREIVCRQWLERRPDADPVVDDELRATARGGGGGLRRLGGLRRPLVTAVADAVDHVVRVGREA